MRTRLDPDERRRQILEAARVLFSERHYSAVSLDQVAESAGITRGLLHHYFGTKRELYLAVIRHIFRETAPPVPEHVRGLPRDERLEASVDLWLDMVWRNRETWLAALGAEGLGHDRDVEEILERVSEHTVDGILEVLGLGPAQDAPPHVRAVLRAYGGLAEAATREWLQRGRLDRDQVRVLLVQTLLRLVEEVLPQVAAEAGGQSSTAPSHSENAAPWGSLKLISRPAETG